LQWAPGTGVGFRNIYDDLSGHGFDDWLHQAKSVPPPQSFP